VVGRPGTLAMATDGGAEAMSIRVLVGQSDEVVLVPLPPAGQEIPVYRVVSVQSVLEEPGHLVIRLVRQETQGPLPR
jgi:hypothetical protein